MRAALAAVGSSIPVEVDGDVVASRNVLVTVSAKGFLGERVDGERAVQMFAMPASATASAASAAVIAVLSEVVSRAAEAEAA